MQSPKIFILLPDGIGLRNFAFTNFHQLGLENGFEITFWNATPFDLTKLGFNEIKIVNSNGYEKKGDQTTGDYGGSLLQNVGSHDFFDQRNYHHASDKSLDNISYSEPNELEGSILQ
jgi:hypothetical protein